MGETVSLASTLSGIERLVVGFCRFFALSLLSWIVSLSPSRRLSISPSLCFPFMLHDAGCIPRSSSPRTDSPTTEAVRSNHYRENELFRELQNSIDCELQYYNTRRTQLATSPHSPSSLPTWSRLANATRSSSPSSPLPNSSSIPSPSLQPLYRFPPVRLLSFLVLSVSRSRP